MISASGRFSVYSHDKTNYNMIIDIGHNRELLLDANPGLRSMYDENDGNTAVYFLKDAKATISSFTHDPIEINF